MARGTPGRPARINIDLIESAVIEVGFDKVSTTVVAKHLGVEQSSLYRHISSRRGLLLAAIRRVVADTTFPQHHDSWRNYLTAIAETVWNMLEKHPGLAGVIFELDAPTPEQLTGRTQETIDVLQGYGFTAQQSLRILETLLHVTATAVLKAEHAEQVIANATNNTDPSQLETILRMTHVREDDRIWWEECVTLILDGAQYQLERHYSGDSERRTHHGM
ncbi:TetR/AcrR family transcriptional regulator [Corynebacterium choanae]|uniref:Tetracycline repressor protein class A n=1 Tax=Corynebacterium choanae TaxID=1862358 RepID=A0A3G6J4P3_9CORY|nr:TetR/AcrR family transcriptional regulator C-terminal domain-containing protein [Corynebacterium choanae]AZA12862.1 Tetracycline repressor protein class A [Corynebacterium choanae]